jgi:hypothetical protein
MVYRHLPSVQQGVAADSAQKEIIAARALASSGNHKEAPASGR